MQYDVKINGMDFDFVQYDQDQDMYVKILDGVDEILTMELFHKIEAATTKNRPFYSNMYYIFSIQPVASYLQLKLDFVSVVLVDADKFFTRDYISFLEKR